MDITLLKGQAAGLGFNLIGITPAVPSPQLEAYLWWINEGMHGEMNYLARDDRRARRQDLDIILPGVRSIIMVGLDYAALNIPQELLRDPMRGRISNYAWGSDYHDVMASRLESLADWLREAAKAESRHRVYVDTGAILERSHAQQAGLGFIGKNTMLIHPRRGSYFFLGEILTTLEFQDYDEPHPATMCGTCTRCLMACPTNAFPQPYILDARRCISYLTIELKSSIPEHLRPLLGNWIYGCDICQEVCPFVTRFTHPAHDKAFIPADVERAAPPLMDLLQMTQQSFKKRFARSPIFRTGYERLLRNVCVAAGNARSPELQDLLHSIVVREEEIPMAAAHARWALSLY